MDDNKKQQNADAFQALVSEFHADIPFMAKTLFNSTLRPKQIEFVEAFRNNKMITFRGGVGFGKTHALAVLVWWALITHNNIQVTILGPNEGQIKSGIWKELEILYERMNPVFQQRWRFKGEKIERVKNSANNFCEFRLANKDNISATRGIHQVNNFVFVDEATGVDEVVFTDSLLNILTDPNPKLCLISNPSSTTGYFYRTWNDPDISDEWAKVHGSMWDNTAMTTESLERMAKQYGGITSRQYRVLVEGEFPLDEEDGVIPRFTVERAINNTSSLPSPERPIIWGLDVAQGKDSSVLTRRRDNTVLCMPDQWNGLDTTQLSHKVYEIYTRCKPEDRPKVIAVDANGIGRGVADVLRKSYRLPVELVSTQGSPHRDPNMFLNLRAQIWWDMREWFEKASPCIPKHNRLIEELCTPRYSDARGKIKVESKDDLKKRLRGSPDFADSLALTFAVNESRWGGGDFGWENPIDYGPMEWVE